MLLVYVCHLLAFGLSWLAIVRINSGDSWYFTDQKLVDNYKLHIAENSTVSLWALYVSSFYFGCTTLTTIGYGDYKPFSPGNRVVFMFIFVIGYLIRT